ncbi:MAG: iron chelate uptake ABC transporter family permease subunit [Fusobacteriaceae bacterium]|nr:iron chelate uptake ABC transporter family permease subunit [Fusobacteriaceae bacterium]
MYTKEKIILLFISISLVSISIAITRAISFLSLISLHISRMLVDSRKICFPTSMLVGAPLIITADITWKKLLPNGIPTGIVVALIGVPYFIYLINRKK